MMSSHELTQHLSILRLSPAEAAQLLGVSPRTLRRWIEGEDVPGPAEAALRAWRLLDDRNLAWQPDSVSLLENDKDQIARHRQHAKELAALVKRVDARGGPKNPWTVDLVKGKATFGHYEIGFYKMLSEGFSLSTYRRKDTAPDVVRDGAEIEDAAFCISKAFGRARACSIALRAVATYTREHASLSAQDRAKPANLPERQRAIVALAQKIDELATSASEGRAKYEQFEVILGQLHAVGFFPAMSLISAVAHAFA